MKKLNIIILLLLAVTGIQAQTYVQKKSAKIIVTPEVSKKLLAEVEQGKAYLVDVRTPDEYNKEHLKYAANINIKGADFADQVKKLDKTKHIYLYCHSGNRSGRAADSLATLGYSLGYNIGAIDSLTKAGFPVQQAQFKP
ncbi:rhodanese-like domain-containing protein [Mucilaginibacter ginsenosidivorax]|uniref:Rhodanese-like domain-containing protein n=1 Tax=Mucilaginibacter ginsenosidivorax TaxID=862126 RepID=A0A5B8W263_9SPHI|nr:rhodanese-like domain-containing protein [Mucilaginibacter ginsenosidivorax]QEC76428.1 rhodanese-like domain-containing protein [Mucilaginibacter ginsenosidivorax]